MLSIYLKLYQLTSRDRLPIGGPLFFYEVQHHPLGDTVHNAHIVKQDASVCKNDQCRIRRYILLPCIIYSCIKISLYQTQRNRRIYHCLSKVGPLEGHRYLCNIYRDIFMSLYQTQSHIRQLRIRYCGHFGGKSKIQSLRPRKTLRKVFSSGLLAPGKKYVSSYSSPEI